MFHTELVENEKIILKLNGSISINDAAEFWNVLSDSLNRTAELEIDLTDALDCDLSVVQVLYAAKKTAEEMNRRISITNMPPAILNMLIYTGFNPSETLCDPKGYKTNQDTRKKTEVNLS